MSDTELMAELKADNTRAWMQVEAITRERDEATRCLHWSNGEILTLRQEIARLEALNAAARRRYKELAETCDTAGDAAETYHAAWEDAAVHWKAERDELRREKARLEGLDALNRMQRDESDGERSRLRAALEKYGRHRIDCRWLTGPCTCGLDAVLEMKEEPGNS